MGPMPPLVSPKKVGDSEALNCSRLFWNTHAPPVARFRIPKNGLSVDALATPMVGCSFQVLRASRGRLMPVSQLSPVWKLPGKTEYTSTESFGSGVEKSGCSNESTWRPVVRLSCIVMALRQLKAPTRSGVSKLKEVTREFWTWASVSTPPSGLRESSGASWRFRSSVRTRLSPGDQVMLRPRSSGLGEIVSEGNWVLEVLSDRF